MHISGYLPLAVQTYALYSDRVTFHNVEEKNIAALQSELGSVTEHIVIDKDMDADAEFQFVCTFYSHMHSISEILTTTSFEQLVEFEALREAVGMVIGRLNSSKNKNNPIFGAALALALLENGVILPEDPVIAQAVLNRLILSKKGDTPNEFTMPKEYNKSRDGYKTYRQVPNHHYHLLVADSSGNVMDVGEESDIHSTEKDIVWNEPVYKKSSELDDFKKTVMVKKRSAQNTDESDQESTLLSTGHNIKLPEPLADELWSWRERLSALQFAEVGHLLRTESKTELYKRDTRFGENICHALVICFSSPQLDEALEIQRYRNFESLCDITDNDFNLPLHTAVKNCKPEAVEILGLMSPRAIQVGDGGRQTPLQLAFDTRQTACLQSLLKVATKYDDKGNLCGDILQPMLIRSIKCGYFDVLNILSELNNPQMDWNCTGDDGNTAWYHLLAHPQSDIEETVNILVNCNLDPMDLIVYHKTGASLQSVLTEAFESNESEYVEVRECQQQQKKIYIKRSKLPEPLADELWSWRERLSALQFAEIGHLLRTERKIELYKRDTRFGENICHALVVCFSSPQLVDALEIQRYRNFESLCDITDNDFNLPLHTAVKNCKPEAVEILGLMSPRAIQVGDGGRQTPLQLAFDTRQTACLQSLLKIATKYEDKGNLCGDILQPMLIRSIKCGYFDVLNILSELNNPQMDWNCTGDDGNTAWYHLLAHPQSDIEETVNILVNCNLDPMDLIVYHKTGASLQSVLTEAFESNESEYVEVRECQQQQKKIYIKRSKLEELKYRPCSATKRNKVASKESDEIAIKPLGSSSQSSENEMDKKVVHLSSARKHQRKQVEKRIQETRANSTTQTESSTCDESDYCDTYYTDITELIDVKIEASLLPSHFKTCQVKPSVLHIQTEEYTQESKTDDSEGDIELDHHEQYTHKQTESKFNCCSSDHLWTDVKHHLMHLKLSLMCSMIVKATDLEHIQVMRGVVLAQPLRHQVYDTHALVVSQPMILSTVLKATVQDFIRSNSFIAFKNALSTELHYLFGICRPTVSRIYTSTIEMFKLIVSAMRPVRRSIPSNIKENINTTVTIFNEKTKMLTNPSKLWVILRGGDLKKKKKKEMAAHMPAQEEKSISLQHATRHSEPLDIPSAALTLVNKSNPLEVVRSHFQVYSKCCTRHDIQNILAIGTEYPASAAFASSSSHSSSASTASNYSIHSLKDDTTHRPFNATAKYDRNKQFREHSSLQVMLANRTAPREKPVEPITESHLLPAAREPLASLQPVGRRLEIKGMQNETKFSNEMQTASNVSTRVLLPNTTTEIENSRHRQEPSSMRLAEHGIYVDEQKKDVSKEVLNRSIPTAEQTINDTKRNEPSHHHFNYDREQNDNIKTLAELLHAQDYARIVPLAYDGQPPMSFPPDVRIQYIFITGLAYYKMSNHKKSVQYFQKCLEMAEECHRDGDVTICNIYIGDIDFSKRKYTDAAVRYQSALYHYSRDSVAKDFRMILPTKSAVWLKCGSAFKNASRMGDAVAAYEKAVELASSKKDQLSAHTSLGNLFQGIGENGRAMNEYEAAIVLATELEDNISLGWNHGNLGNALLGLHQRDKALYHLFKALDMAVVHEMTPQAIGRAYNNLGTAFQSLNELSKAEEQYDLALAQAIYGNDIAGQARVYGNIGNLQMLSKQYDRAVPHYTEVMRLSQDKATITTAHHNRGCAYYDWAEKKKKAFFARTIAGFSSHSGTSIQELSSTSESPRNKIKSLNVDSAVVPLGSQKDSASEDTSVMNHSPGFKVSLHGPDFKRCEEIYKPMFVPEGVQKYYLQGTRDLDYVIRHHEENFSGIKGSPKGLSLSVSLFESNSRTFHRMQDCLVHLQKSDDQPSRFEDALLVAEQCRARTLGELLLKRRGPQLEHQLKSPPSIHQLKSIVARQSCPVVYLSYTGERLLGWILYPTPDNECTINMFEVPLSDTEFDGKSFDYHLRYSLNEQLVEKSFEMYKPFDHQKDKTEPLEKLYDLVAQPLMTMLSKLDKQKQKEEDGSSSRDRSKPNTKVDQSSSKVRKIIIIPDSYTNLLPFTCVLDKETGKFWGDSYYFQIMPSLLTMGISDQLPTVAVSIPVQYQQMLCVVGNPTIPRFKFNNNDWDLGKLPHATKEAEWVSHILKCNPILHEQATKDAVMMRLMNAKVIHLATHGSAASGFLAFAGMNSSTKEAIDAKKVLIYPEEVESLNISPALVVLSSCDSGRGVFKADGIQGMARAFILAGAQAVLTALWRVPDESACIFMQFFYQYLVDGLRGTEALHKAILSLRCFSKYSQYIHWSGYQLTGREFQFNINQSPARAELTTRLGTSSVFPRLEILKELEAAFMNNPRPPTDVQVCYIFCFCSKAETLSLCIIIIYYLFVSGFAWTTWSETL